jgi:hypothetical protein
VDHQVGLEVEFQGVDQKLNLQDQEDKAVERQVEVKVEALVEVGEAQIQVSQEDDVIYGLK